jgi:tetratricopeptide (TPR) repeat protein
VGVGARLRAGRTARAARRERVADLLLVVDRFACRGGAPCLSIRIVGAHPTPGELESDEKRATLTVLERWVHLDVHRARLGEIDDPLRALWDFDDLDLSEARFRARAAETSGSDRAEVLTQLARVHGLRGSFDEGDELLNEASSLAGTHSLAAARVDLERGRLRRSSGDTEAALPLFESAFAVALDAGAAFVAADAAHMAALAASAREAFVTWTRRGIGVAERHEGAAYWVGPLQNNLGWEHYEAGEYEPALEAFRAALAARERDPDNADGIELALYAVGKTLRALGRSAEAVPLLQRAVASAARRGHEDGWYHEELAEEYASVGRHEDAREQAKLAIPLLERDDPTLAEDTERRERLSELVSGVTSL